MTEPLPPPQQGQIQMSTSSEVEAGVHADFAGVWHHSSSFVLDFAALTGPPQLSTDDQGRPSQELRARMVARVRIAPSQVFEIMKALEQQLSKWERETGQRPTDPTS
jgi:hypothetical protein